MATVNMASYNERLGRIPRKIDYGVLLSTANKSGRLYEIQFESTESDEARTFLI